MSAIQRHHHSRTGPKTVADAIRRKVTERCDKSHYGGTAFPRAKSETTSTTPSIRLVVQPPTNTITAESYRAASTIAPGSSLSAPRRNSAPSRQLHPQLASSTPPSVRACAAQTLAYSRLLFGATLIVDQGPRSGGVHALA
ncbi:hypothetical protein VE00_02286 [Pseudogymnoascus sp. WSF 3629]|nr:hypothetical protein VE00_02286 [Pseudogymnoascus sp. WSF 3629]